MEISIMTFTTINSQALAQNVSPKLAPDFEIDSAEDGDFGTLYRMWKGYLFLGSFYQSLDGKWITQPSNTECRQECDTEYQAQLVILAMLGLVVPMAA
jgi:hypothetical protein